MKKTILGHTAFITAALLSFNVVLQAQPVVQTPGLPTETPPALVPNQVTLDTRLSSEIKPLPVLAAMQRVADWQLTNPSAHRRTDWTQGAGYAGFMALAGISGDAKYRDAMRAMGETNGWKPGPLLYDADDHCVGQTYAELYLLYREPKMIAPMAQTFDAILVKPSEVTSLAYTNPQKKARENWSWCDALFMGPPAWVRLYAATGDEKYLTFAVTNWWRTTDFLYDREEHLYFRDSNYFDKREANGKKVFWSRGNGWVMAGLVRVLQYLPTNHPDRPRFEQLFKDMSAKLLTCQQPDGLWRASLLDPDSYPLKETSGSGFYTYALAWGVNQGLLDRAQFEPAVRNAWTALVGCVDAEGKLTHVQPIGADPKKFAEDSSEVYGVGAFLLAGSEVYRMAVLEKIDFDEGEIVPLTQFNDMPITEVIDHLARFGHINYVFDPKIGYGRVDASGMVTNPEPIISLHWTNMTAKQTLLSVLKIYGLKMVQTPNGGPAKITSKYSKDANPTSLPAILTVKNPASFGRDCETVEFDLQNVSVSGLLAVVDGVSSRILDSQIYREADGMDKLLVQVDLAPNETRKFYILDANALAALPPPIVKTFARYVPERYDDFAWESDRIAHRIYGQALIKAEGTVSSGADVWIKKDRGLIVDKMYATKHYHEDNGSFMDDYRVGKSRGCGGLGIWDGKKLFVSSNWKNWKLITTGPIRSEFELTYDEWDVGNGRKVSEVKRFSIDAGSWMTKAQCTLSSDDKTTLPIGVGLAERACPTNREEFIEHDLTEGWMTYWQPEDQPKGTTAVAFVLPKGAVKEFTNDNPDMPDTVKHAAVPQPTHEGYPPIRTQLAVTQAEVDKPFTYYFGACWDRSGDFTNHVQWENYVKRFAERRDQPLQVTVGN